MLDEIQQILESKEVHAMRITHQESNTCIERPGYAPGDKTRYLIHLSDLPDSDAISFIKEKAKELGSGSYKVEIRKRNGSTYVPLQPVFNKVLPIQVQEEGRQHHSNQQSQNLRMYHTQQDYNRIVEEKESLKTRLNNKETETYQLKMQVLDLQQKLDTSGIKHELALEQLKIKLENEKAQWIRSQKKFTDNLDLNKLIESPNLPKILKAFKPGAEVAENPGLAAPKENLTQPQTMFITVVKQMQDEEIKTLYLTHHLSKSKPEFKTSIQQLIATHKNERAN